MQGALGSIRTLALGTGSMFYSAIYSYSIERGKQYAFVAFIAAALIVFIGFAYTLRLFFANEHFAPYEDPVDGIPMVTSSSYKSRTRSTSINGLAKDLNNIDSKE